MKRPYHALKWLYHGLIRSNIHEIMLAKTRQFHKSKNPNCSYSSSQDFSVVRLKGRKQYLCF